MKEISIGYALYISRILIGMKFVLQVVFREYKIVYDLVREMFYVSMAFMKL